MNLEKIATADDLERAFTEFNTLLFQYTYARVRDRATAEDIVQEAFFKAWRCRESFDPVKSSLKNWLFAITIDTLRDHFRKLPQTTFHELPEETAGGIAPDQEFTEENLVAFVFSQIKHLSERDQELLILRYTDGLPVQDIADILHLKYSATKVALHRALSKLKDLCETS